MRRPVVSEVFRKDMRSKLDTPYGRTRKHPADTHCPRCGVAFVKGVWSWPARAPSRPPANPRLCPACRRVRDRYPGGVLTVSGSGAQVTSDALLLGQGEPLPPGEGGLNANLGFFFMWHSHAEKELTNFDIFPGGMMTHVIIEPPGTAIDGGH